MIIRNMDARFADDKKLRHLCYIRQLPGRRRLGLQSAAEIGKEAICVCSAPHSGLDDLTCIDDGWSVIEWDVSNAVGAERN